MADNIEQQTQNQIEQATSAETTMSETESQTPAPPAPLDSKPPPFSIWPPSQRTRDAVTNRLIETLTTESVLSKRYGTVPHNEAADLANKIEEEAFSSASSLGAKPEDDGIEILQAYSKEISKRMLEAVKSRSAAVDDVAEVKKGENVVAADGDAGEVKEEGEKVEVADDDVVKEAAAEEV